MIPKIPSPVSGGLILSYRYSAECKQYIYGCSPNGADWFSVNPFNWNTSLLNGQMGRSGSLWIFFREIAWSTSLIITNGSCSGDSKTGSPFKVI